MYRWHVLIALTAGVVPAAAAPAALAQDTTRAARPPIAATLSLADALAQARANSPTYRQVLNDANPARWGVRNAYASFLPTASVSAGMSYTGTGQSQFGAFNERTPSFVGSDYSIGFQWQLDGRVLSGPSQQKALQRATAEDIAGAGVTLRAEITDQYLTTLQATAQVGVARQQVQRNEDFVRLAQARYQVGQATLLDVRQAEVTRGRSEVALLRAVQAENEAKLELLRRMGVEAPVAVDQIALSDSFPVTEPAFELDALLATARENNPAVRSLRARGSAADAEVRAAKSEYLPRLQAQAGWSGFTQQFTNTNQLLGGQLAGAQGSAASCAFDNQVRTGLGLGGETPDCNAAFGLTADGLALQPGVAQGFRDANRVFPFDYTGQPFQASLSISLPLFTGFGRTLRVAQARASQQDADESVRARQLQVRTEVQARHLGLGTSYRAIAVQAANREAAREQLRLAQDRYRLGSGTSLELSDAQNAIQQAEGDYVNAIYDYHKAVAALEAAVGRSLR